MADISVDDLKSFLLSLDQRRKVLEIEAQAITDELSQSIDGKEPMGLNTPLVDKEGYPRADIDIYRARHLRKRLNEIRFDHDVIMKEIEQKVLQQQEEEHRKTEFTERRKRKPKPKMDPISGKWVVRNWDGTISGVENGHLRSFDEIDNYALKEAVQNSVLPLKKSIERLDDMDVDVIPFAKIENVMNKSPAELARLKLNDLVVTFGTLDHTNHRDLRALGEVVASAHMDHSEIPITVLRQNDGAERLVSLTLKPTVWEGKGLVGCTFSPIRF